MNISTKKFFAGAVNLGLALGYRRSNWLIDLSTSEDEALIDIDIQGFGYPNYPGFISRSKLGITFQRHSLVVGRKITTSEHLRSQDRSWWELWGMAGVSIWQRYSEPVGIVEEKKWALSSSDTITIALHDYTQAPSATFITAGFALKGYNRKGHSTVNLSASFGLRVSSAFPFAGRLRFDQRSTANTAFVQLRTPGDGLYVMISKDFYFNNIPNIWRKRTKEAIMEP